jgi:hypothetical protein
MVKLIEKFNVIPEFYKEIIIINCWVEFGGGQTKTLKVLNFQVSCPKIYSIGLTKTLFLIIL